MQNNNLEIEIEMLKICFKIWAEYSNELLKF